MDDALAARPAGAPVAPAVALAAALSLSVALVHLGGVTQHLDVWWGYGAFFLVTGLAQAALGPALVWRPRRWVAALGVAGNLAIAGVYVLTRTSGLPVGPHAGRYEEAELLGMATTAGELVLVLLLVPMLGERAQRPTFTLLLLLGALLWILRVTGSLV